MDKGEKRRLRHLLLLLQRAKFDTNRRKPTFMEVAGVSRREITISNILAFLLDSESEHNMGNLWLRSLLLAASDVNIAFNPSEIQVAPASSITEVVTRNVDANLRIDVVVETPGLVLGIENKIGATLYNDLESYAGQVRDMAGDRVPLLLTLTLHEESAATAEWADKCQRVGVSLCNVTYGALFDRVKESMGVTLLDADQEWLCFTRDFMRTIDHLGVSAMEMDRELFDFVGENKQEILLMRDKMREVARITKAQSQRLCEMLSSDEEIQGMGLPRPRVWQPSDTDIDSFAYFDVPLYGRGQRVHPEIKNNITCMRIQCFVSNSAAKAAVLSTLAEGGINARDLDESHVMVWELPLETQEELLVERLRELINALLPLMKL